MSSLGRRTARRSLLLTFVLTACGGSSGVSNPSGMPADTAGLESSTDSAESDTMVTDTLPVTTPMATFDPTAADSTAAEVSTTLAPFSGDALVVCSVEHAEILWLEPSTGQVVQRSHPNTMYGAHVNNTYTIYNSGDACPHNLDTAGFEWPLYQTPPLPAWNAALDHAVGLMQPYPGDDFMAAVFSASDPMSAWVPLVEPPAQSDFNPIIAIGLAVTFWPDDSGRILYRESSGGSCKTYVINMTEAPLPRGELESHLAGTGGFCFNSSDLVLRVTADGLPIACVSGYTCQDLNGADTDRIVIDSENFVPTLYGPSTSVTMPQSDRFELSTPMLGRDGLVYFTGFDDDTRTSTLFSWSGASEDEPTAIAPVGPGSYTVLGETDLEVTQPATTEPPAEPGSPFVFGTAPCPPADAPATPPDVFEGAPQKCIDESKSYTAVITTNFGTLRALLNTSRSPGNVNNFVVLSRYGYYDGTDCHRVIASFIVQCGRRGGNEFAPGYTVADELSSPGEYQPGVVAIANMGSANTGGAQFFIVTGASGEALPATYTIIGRLDEVSMPVLATLDALADPAAENGVPPLQPIAIESVVIEES